MDASTYNYSDYKTRIESLEKRVDKTDIILDFMSKELGQKSMDIEKIYMKVDRVFEKLDATKNMVILSLVSTVLTLIGVISLYMTK
jgi:uncharacterized coiled-coil protein SlyX